MAIVVCRVSVTVLLMTLMLMSEIFANEFKIDPEMRSYGEEELAEKIPYSYIDNEKYIRHIRSSIDAYRNDIFGRRIAIETNDLVDTKYKAWKRNADLINSLLALPKGLNDAGR